MASFKPQFARVKGVSERRRLPRLGKVRLGVKVVSPKTGNEYPKETDYFVCPPEVQKIYGEQPKELDVMFAINDPEVIFPQSYCWYGSSKGIKCKGDGERAMRATEDGFKEIECPCEKLESKECQFRAHLMVILYKVSLGGVYQIDLGSFHSTIDINSGLDYTAALIGRFAMVPFKLRRVEKETHHDGKKQIHYTLILTPEVDLNSLNELRGDTQRVLTGPRYVLPAPENLNPQFDNGAVIVEEAEETKSEPEASEAQGNSQAPAPDPGQVERSEEKSLDDQILELLEKAELPGTQKEALKRELPELGIKTKEARLEWLRGLTEKEAEHPEAAKEAAEEKKAEKESERGTGEEPKATDEDRDDILNLLEFAEPPEERGEAIKTELKDKLTKARAEELKRELNTLIDQALIETENEATNQTTNQPITEKQHKLLEIKLKESGIDRETFKQWLHDSLKYLQPYDTGELHMNQIGSKHFQSLMEDWDVTVNGFKTWKASQPDKGQEKLGLS